MTPKTATLSLVREIQRLDAQRENQLKRLSAVRQRELDAVTETLYEFTRRFSAVLTREKLHPRPLGLNRSLARNDLKVTWGEDELSFTATHDGIHIALPGQKSKLMTRLPREKVETAALRHAHDWIMKGLAE